MTEVGDEQCWLAPIQLTHSPTGSARRPPCIHDEITAGARDGDSQVFEACARSSDDALGSRLYTSKRHTLLTGDRMG